MPTGDSEMEKSSRDRVWTSCGAMLDSWSGNLGHWGASGARLSDGCLVGGRWVAGGASDV